MPKSPQIETFNSQFIPAINYLSQKLIIVLHGLGDSLKGYVWLPEELNLPDFNYLLIDAPDTYYDGYSWYNFEGKQELGIVRSRKLLFALFDELKEQNWQTENIVLFGFSQGCVMALDLGLHYAGQFMGICGISGYLFPSKNISPFALKQQFLITYGKYDEIVPPSLTIASITTLKSLGLQLSEKQFSKGHTIDFIEEFPFIQNWFKQLK